MKGISNFFHQKDINDLNSTLNSVNNKIVSLQSSISTYAGTLSTIEEDIQDIYKNKADKYYNYKVVTTVPNNSNLNNYKTVGSYSITSNSSASTISNLPVAGNSGTLHVINCLGTANTLTGDAGLYEYFLQIFVGYTAFVYIRSIQNNGGTVSYNSWKALT